MVIREEADGDTGEFGGTGDKTTEEGSSVTVDTRNVLPEELVVINVVSAPGYGDREIVISKVLGDTPMLDVNERKDDSSDVRASERVAGSSERPGGVMLPGHSVVPLMIE